MEIFVSAVLEQFKVDLEDIIQLDPGGVVNLGEKLH